MYLCKTERLLFCSVCKWHHSLCASLSVTTFSQNIKIEKLERVVGSGDKIARIQHWINDWTSVKSLLNITKPVRGSLNSLARTKQSSAAKVEYFCFLYHLVIHIFLSYALPLPASLDIFGSHLFHTSTQLMSNQHLAAALKWQLFSLSLVGSFCCDVHFAVLFCRLQQSPEAHPSFPSPNAFPFSRPCTTNSLSSQFWCTVCRKGLSGQFLAFRSTPLVLPASFHPLVLFPHCP